MKAKGRESKRNKKKKPSGIHSVEADTMAETVDKTLWLMFTVVNSQGRCKELIVPMLINGKSVDMDWILVPLGRSFQKMYGLMNWQRSPCSKLTQLFRVRNRSCWRGQSPGVW